MIIKADKGYAHYIDEQQTDWAFTVASKGGEVGLIQPASLDGKPKELRVVENCIIMLPEEFADLLEALEKARDEGLYGMPIEDARFMDGWKKAMNLAIMLLVQKTGPDKEEK